MVNNYCEILRKNNKYIAMACEKITIAYYYSEKTIDSDSNSGKEPIGLKWSHQSRE